MDELLTEIDAHTYQVELFVKPRKPKFSIEVWAKSIDVLVTAPPSKGKANKEIIQGFSDILDIHSDHVKIIRGHKNNIKILQITSLTEAEILEIFSKYQPTQMMQ